MILKRYTQIRVGDRYEVAVAEYECGCGSRTVVNMPDDHVQPKCRACRVAYQRMMTRVMSTTFRAKDFKPVPPG